MKSKGKLEENIGANKNAQMRHNETNQKAVI